MEAGRVITKPVRVRGYSRRRRETNDQMRRTIASYESYAEAERAVDFLSDQGFAVERFAIIGPGLATGRAGHRPDGLRSGRA
ncbi:general stress protein [Streptomyces mirabilis]|uniref:general stress protein n=1 Tax=Streptomyces mirabilis TaxID=68239 RepID=UPI0034E987EB